MTTPELGDTGNNVGPANDSVEADVPICPEAASSFITTPNQVDKDSAHVANSPTAGAASSESVKENIKATLLQAELKKVVTLPTSQSNNEQNVDDIGRSDCGQAKRRRLTDAQEI
jgi:hypothetical protein